LTRYNAAQLRFGGHAEEAIGAFKALYDKFRRPIEYPKVKYV
jgi:hypothetical protein